MDHIIVERHYIPINMYRELYLPQMQVQSTFSPLYLSPTSMPTLIPIPTSATYSTTPVSMASIVPNITTSVLDTQPQLTNDLLFENIMNLLYPNATTHPTTQTHPNIQTHPNTQTHPIFATTTPLHNIRVTNTTVTNTDTTTGGIPRGLITLMAGLFSNTTNTNANIADFTNIANNIPIEIELNNITPELLFARFQNIIDEPVSNGLTPANINRISTVFKYGVGCEEDREDEEDGEDGEDGEDVMHCAICQNECVSDNICRQLNVCQHIFHLSCIDIWLSEKNTCPTCRHNVLDVLAVPETNIQTNETIISGSDSPDMYDSVVQDDVDIDDTVIDDTVIVSDVIDTVDVVAAYVTDVTDAATDATTDAADAPHVDIDSGNFNERGSTNTNNGRGSNQIHNFIESDGFSTFIDLTTPFINNAFNSNASPTETRARLGSFINNLIGGVNPILSGFDNLLNQTNQFNTSFR